jgi:hypothetical protein
MILIRCPVLLPAALFFSSRVLAGWAGGLASMLLILPPTPRRAAGATNGTGSTVHRRRLERVRKSRVDTPGIVSMRRAAHASTALAMLASRLPRSLSLQSVPSDVDTMTTGLAAAQAALDAYEYDRASELLEAALVESRGGLDVARALLELLVDVLGLDADALAVEPGSRRPARREPASALPARPGRRPHRTGGPGPGMDRGRDGSRSGRSAGGVCPPRALGPGKSNPRKPCSSARDASTRPSLASRSSTESCSSPSSDRCAASPTPRRCERSSSRRPSGLGGPSLTRRSSSRRAPWARARRSARSTCSPSSRGALDAEHRRRADDLTARAEAVLSHERLQRAVQAHREQGRPLDARWVLDELIAGGLLDTAATARAAELRLSLSDEIRRQFVLERIDGPIGDWWRGLLHGNVCHSHPHCWLEARAGSPSSRFTPNAGCCSSRSSSTTA